MTWWRRNRWGLVALLPALALAMAASSSRVHLFWWSYDLHRPTAGQLGQTLAFTDSFEDRRGTQTRSVSVRLVSVTRTDAALDADGVVLTAPLPPGAQWFRVTLHVEADPRMPLRYCRVAIVDTRGRVAESVGLGGVQDVSLDPCVPTTAPGPASTEPDALAKAAESPRPAAYDVEVFLYAAADATVERVRVWWSAPNYLEFRL